MSFGLVHLIVFWCGEIHVASLGDDQFSFGATAPPSSAILSLIAWCSSGNLWFGGSLGGSSSSSSSLSESESESSPLGIRGWGAPEGPDCHSSSSSSSAAVPSSSAKTMPSSRMYSMNSGDSGIIRDLIHDVRYLCELLVNYSVFISVVLFLFLL